MSAASESPGMASRSGRSARVAWVSLGTAAAYVLVAWAALGLAGPPGYASPLYPSAGIALAAVLTYGRAAWPGVLLGAFVANAGLAVVRGQSGLAALPLPLAIGCGAALQAACGAWLIQRFVATPVALNTLRDIVLAGLLGAVVACAVSPSVATVALALAGLLDAGSWGANWLTWWSGDTLGVLIGAPLALTLIGQPREDWRPRRRTLGLPLVVALALVAAAMVQVGRIDRERERLAFERRVDRILGEAEDRLRTPLHALQSLHAAVMARGAADEQALRAAARWWLGQPRQLRAMGYSERVARADLDIWAARVRAEGTLPQFRVFQRDGGLALAADGEAVVVRRIEPPEGNAAALGVNALSTPAARAAILSARDSGEPAASAGFQLTQARGDETGMVLYQALYAASPADAAARAAAFRGVLFVTIDTQGLLAGLARNASDPKVLLLWCLRDAGQGPNPPRLAGNGDCSAKADAMAWHATRGLEFGGRRLELDVLMPRRASAATQEREQLLSLVGLGAAALLGALLLTVTGHNRRTELAVQAGTAELRREIAERQQAEEALRHSEARLRSIVDHNPLGVAFLDPHGQMLEPNPRLAEMLGRRADQLVGRNVVELAHPEDVDLIRGHRADLLAAAAGVAQRQLRLRRADGTDLHVRISASVLRDGAGHPTRIVAVVEDIAEHLRLQDAERAVHRAEAASRAKSEFVSRMSHELRTPLNAMIGFAQLMGLEPALPPRQQEWAQQIQRAGWHLLELINETLDLARIEAGAVELEPEPVDLVALVHSCQALLASAIAQRRLHIEVQAEPGLAPALADPARLRQIVTNLLSNAIKYNHEDGQVSVQLRTVPAPGGQRASGEGHPSGADDAGPAGAGGAQGAHGTHGTHGGEGPGEVEVVVADSGLGMSESQLLGLFQPFNRLGREGSAIEGTGIGLVISRRLAELMGGALQAESAAGVGSRFTLRLPAARALPAAVPAPAGAEPLAYHQRRLLYVEDNPTNVEVMRGVLLQRPQIRLDVAALGLDGLDVARRLRPDLILLDMQLPDVSGLELLRHLKNDDALAGIPVVVVSADATVARIEEALTAGALRYVTKPLEVASFLQVLDEAMYDIETRFDV